MLLPFFVVYDRCLYFSKVITKHFRDSTCVAPSEIILMTLRSRIRSGKTLGLSVAACELARDPVLAGCLFAPQARKLDQSLQPIDLTLPVRGHCRRELGAECWIDHRWTPDASRQFALPTPATVAARWRSRSQGPRHQATIRSVENECDYSRSCSGRSVSLTKDQSCAFSCCRSSTRKLSTSRMLTMPIACPLSSTGM